MKKVKKIFFPVLFFTLFILPSFSRARATVTDTIDEYASIYVDCNKTPSRQCFTSPTDGIMKDLMAGTILTISTPEHLKETAGDGAIQGLGKMIATTYSNQPASIQTYVADIFEGAGVVQPVYAQGLGFSSLQPVLELWKTFRNIAYVFFVIIFLVIGFAIMFRQNLGGQAAVTVQQALPKIIIALLAVTFSYAIAGLLIDLMYVLMFFLVFSFRNTGLVDPAIISTDPNSSQSILSQNILEVGYGIISNGFGVNTSNAIGGLVETSLGGTLLAGLAGGMSSILALLIFFVAILIAMFKTLFALIKVYFEIVMSIIFSPFILMMGAVNSGVFANWVKGLAVNLLVFPVLLLFILVSYMFMGYQTGTISVGSQFGESGFLPPFLPGRGVPQHIALIAGIGAMMMMAEVPNFVGRFKPKSVFDELGGLAFGQVKPAVPLAGRLGGMATLATPDALVSGARGFVTAKGSIGDRYKSAKTAASQGWQRGSERGVRLAGWGSRSIGANQPDILNPLTGVIDKKYDPQGHRREKFLLDLENAQQRAALGGVGRPEQKSDDKS